MSIINNILKVHLEDEKFRNSNMVNLRKMPIDSAQQQSDL